MLEASESAAPHMQTGSAAYQQRDLAAARAAFETALALQPNLTPARFNLAVIHRDLEENEQAEAMFQEVIASGEIVAESWNNLGILAVRRESFEDGVAKFRKAIELVHQFPLAHFNLGTLLLRMGQWQEGWREYEWRWQTPTFTPINCPQPQWDGQTLDGTLLLHTEQGIGDVFQFARFIPLIRERCRRVIFLRPDHLACMFDSGDWADEIRSPGEISLDSFQAFLPLMSAPHVLGVSPSDLPLIENYLTPEPRSVDLGPTHVADARLKVGLSWFGSPTYVNDAFRSTRLSTLAPLLKIPGVAFYSLQLEPPDADIQVLKEHESVLRDLGHVQSDLADAAAIVRQLDLVISVDTAMLHLAGAMGVPAWGLLSRRSDWRWFGEDRTNSPWYSSVRLFRQKQLNDWRELIDRVSRELSKQIPPSDQAATT